jgi:glycosyltransferase involved in cell wall biosynthesis
MKILLLGEFSGLHKNLKEGLISYGHKVTVASTGDDWKKIESDIFLKIESDNRIKKIFNRFYLFFQLKDLLGYDIVHIINPFVFSFKYFPTSLYLYFIFKFNKKIYLSAAGDDSFYWKYGREILKYGPFNSSLRYDIKQKKFWMESVKSFKFNQKLADRVDGIIPIMYEYEVAYKNHPKYLSTIPLSISTNSIEYSPNIIKDKIVIFHGLNRYGFKGTKIVEEAFDVLSKKYPNDLELIIDGNMPLDEYLKLIKRVNIIIDQVFSHSCGMNALYSLAMGKVVLGGAEPESLASLKIDKSPVVNIKPTAKDIVKRVEYFLNNKEKIEEIGLESRRFVEKYHESKIVAQKYLNTWGSMI